VSSSEPHGEGICLAHLLSVGQEHAAARALEQLFSEGGLQVANLCADGLGREMQLFTSAREVSLACNRLKQPKVVIVECSHRNAVVRYSLMLHSELSNGQNNDGRPRTRLIPSSESQ